MKRNIKDWFLLISIIFIIILGFVAYFNSLKGEFIWDEDFLIINNTYIKSWSDIKEIFTEDVGAGGGVRSNFYRPLQQITYMLDYSVWKLNVVGFHLTNTLLHIFVALVVYWLIYLICSNKKISFVTSILFLIHPVHTETVAYIADRSDLLSALFILLALVFYIKQLSSRNTRIYILILLSYLFALLSKEYSLIFPVLLVVYSNIFEKKLLIKEFISILSMALIYIILRMTILKFPSSEIVPIPTLFQRIPSFFLAISEYFRLLLLPFNLHMEYVFKLFKFSEPKVITGVITMFFLLSYGFRKRKTDKLISFSIFWYFVTLLPVSNLFPINAYMSEHWLYLPSIGFFLILAQIIVAIYDTKFFRVLAVSFVIILLFFYSYLTIRQNNYWRDRLFFNKRTLQYAPNSPKIHNNLCKVYTEIGNNQEAIMACKKAIALKPNFADAYYNLANVYKISGMYEDAIMTLEKAKKINQNEKIVYYELGSLYEKVSKKKEAIEAYCKATEIDRNYLEAYNNLAAIYADNGDIDRAIELWEKIVRINSNFTTAHFNLAVFYFGQKKYDLAIKHCDQVIKMGNKVDPEFLKLLEPHRK